jgi:hypothetical protein
MRSSFRYAVVALIAIVPLVANAIPITYFYQGPTLPAAAGVPAGVTSISGTFTVDLPASHNDPDVNFPLLDFFFFDGVSFYDPTVFTFINFSRFLTDSTGAVTDFAIGLINPDPITVGENRVLDIRIDPTPTNLLGNVSFVQYCTRVDSNQVCDEVAFTKSNQPGTFSAISVPEPTTLSLLGAGLIGFRLARRRKRVA